MSRLLLMGVGGPSAAALAAGRYFRAADANADPLDPTVANWTVTTTATNDVGQLDHTTYIETSGGGQFLKLLIWLDTLTSFTDLDAAIFGDGLNMKTYGWDGASWTLIDEYAEVIGGAQAWTDLNNRTMDAGGDYLGIMVVLTETSLAGPPYSPRIGDYRAIDDSW